MIPALALLLAVAPPPSAGPPDARPPRGQFEACAKTADTDPAAAQKIAVQWASNGGGVPAAQCLGLARSAAGDWQGAADAFSTAADLAAKTHDRRAADLWVSAGNAALAGGDSGRARVALSSAIADPTMPGAMKGEAFLDRARADVAAGDLPAARSDMNDALALVPADPMGWLLSAALARRMNDAPRATNDIREALMRAPNDADVLFEAGNVAATNGDMDGARSQWARAAAADPQSPAAKSAKAELAASGGMPAPAKPGEGR